MFQMDDDTCVSLEFIIFKFATAQLPLETTLKGSLNELLTQLFFGSFKLLPFTGDQNLLKMDKNYQVSDNFYPQL